jgi:hypothetical protein
LDCTLSLLHCVWYGDDDYNDDDYDGGGGGLELTICPEGMQEEEEEAELWKSNNFNYSLTNCSLPVNILKYSRCL